MKTCKKGHQFDDNPQEYPNCPKESKDKTNLLLLQSNDLTKMSSSRAGNTTAPYFSNEDKTKISGLDKTFIETNQVINFDSRKLIGWLVSFSHNNSGSDFRLYEGGNTIGVDFPFAE